MPVNSAPVQPATYNIRRADGELLHALTSKEIRELAMSNQLFTDDMVCRSGDTKWRAASTLSGLPIRTREAVVVAAPVSVAAPVAVEPDPRTAAAEERSERLRIELDALQVSYNAAEGARAQLREQSDQAADSLAQLQRQCSDLAEASHARDDTASQASAKMSTTIATLERQLEDLSTERAILQEAHSDGPITRALEESLRVQAVVEQLLKEANATRDDLANSLGHSQDALRVADETRRAVERTIATLQVTAAEQTADLTQARASLGELQNTCAALLARTQTAEAAALDARRDHTQANAGAARIAEQRDSAVKLHDGAVTEREAAITDRDRAIADRDTTRVMVASIQTELARTRREFDSALRDYNAASAALAQESTRVTAIEHALGESQAHAQQLANDRGAIQHELDAAKGRVEIAETVATDARRLQSEANTWIARATEQRDAAFQARDGAVSDRDAAIAERDSTRLAVGATQTDLVRLRREFGVLQGEFHAACTALTEQTARAAGLEIAVSEARSQVECVTVDRTDREADIATLLERAENLNRRIAEQAKEIESRQHCAHDAAAQLAETENARDLARADAAQLQSDLAIARESVGVATQRQGALERELAAEQSRIVARDELIFRESLRSEGRETENRRLSADLAALRADHDTQQRRADDAAAQALSVQRDLAASQSLANAQNADMVAAHQDLEKLGQLEEAARAALIATSRERDELASALATSQAAVASREQQVTAERGLRDQAEGSSRQLLASYEKLSQEAGRRITDLEIRLSEASHDMQTVRVREEQANAALAEAHGQAKVVAQKLASVEEQRTAITRDRDSHAKRATFEASARAAAEDKITAANERAAKAERDARTMNERSMQAAMIVLNGSKQRLEGDYARSCEELGMLEQLVAESSQRLIEAGGTVPGVPLLPREAVAKAATDAKVAADAIALLTAKVASASALVAPQSPTVPSVRHEPVRSPAPPTNYRMIDGVADDSALGRPQPARPSGLQSATPRVGGQRERVSQPRTTTASSSDDDSSSSSESAPPQPPPNRLPRRQSSPKNGPQADAALDRAWLDDHCTTRAAETPPRAPAFLALTAMAVAFTATIGAVPEFVALDLRGAFLRIAAWTGCATLLVAFAHAVTMRCHPTLARRIPILAAVTLTIAPVAHLLSASQLIWTPWIVLLLLGGTIAFPWMIAYAAWPDRKQLLELRPPDLAGHFAGRAHLASLATAGLASIAVIATLMPWSVGATIAIAAPPAGILVILLIVLVMIALSPTIRVHAPIVAWSGLAVILTIFAGALAREGIAAVIHSFTAAPWIALIATWCAIAAASLASASTPNRLHAARVANIEDDAPSLVAHERVHAAAVMAISALLPVLPALVALNLARDRSRRAESQLRSLANFELWFAVMLLLAVLSALCFPLAIGASSLVGLLALHGAICLGAAITVGADRFVRFPSPCALITRPETGLDLPTPLVTVQRTVEKSLHRPIVHPCGTTTWGAITLVLGCLAVASLTHSLSLALSLGPIVGLAIFLPALIASRCRHEDTVVIATLSTGALALVASAGFVLDTATKPEGIPTLVAVAGACAGMWALLVGWAFKGMNQLASLVRASSQFEVDAAGDALAPIDHPLAGRRRATIMRRVVIGTCALASTAALTMVLSQSSAARLAPPLVCGLISMALSGAVLLFANFGPMARMAWNALLFTLVLVAASFFAAIPCFFLASEVGALAAISALPFSPATAIAALLAAGVINTLRLPAGTVPPHATRSAERGRTAPARSKTAPARMRIPS